MTMNDFRSLEGTSVATWLPRLGKIRLGILMPAAGTKKEYPKETDYFVLDKDLVYRDQIVAKYGEQPKRLLVMFASNEREEVFPQSLKAYSSVHGLVCRGNGKAAQRVEFEREKEKLVPKKDEMGARVTAPHSCPCPWLEEDKCRAIGNLMVILPEVTLTGIYGIDTGSFWSMTNLNSSLAYAQKVAGRFNDLLFWLERPARETHDGGYKATHYPLTLRMLDVEENAKYRSEIAARYARYCAPVLGTPEVRYALPTGEAEVFDKPERVETPEPDRVERGEAGVTEPNAEVAKNVAAATEPKTRTRKKPEAQQPSVQQQVATPSVAAPNPDLSDLWK